jgi:F-type H+-transporting ATPase subunit delta
MIRGVSRASLDTLRTDVEGAISGLSSTDRSALSEQLAAVGGLLTAQPRLRRALADASARPDARSGLATSILQNKIGSSAMAVTQIAVRLQWSSPWDLVDAIEQAADDILLYDAEQAGSLGEIEDELFRFERILEAEPELTTLLDSAAQPADRRVGLLRDLVSGKVTPVTLQLLDHMIRSGRRRGVTAAIGRLLEDAAVRQDRSVARVVSAVPLTDAQESRLAAVLSEQFGRRISVRTAVEPGIRGGLMIRIGDEVIDGSVSTRLAAARTAVTG